MDIQHKDGIEFLKSLQDNSVDLIITDPPYLISKETGMNIVTEISEVKEYYKAEEYHQKYIQKTGLNCAI